MLNLDLRTLMFFLGLILVAASLGFLLAARIMQQFKELEVWSAANLLQGMGIMLSCMRGVVTPEVAVFGSNLLMFAGQMLIPYALRSTFPQAFPMQTLRISLLACVAVFSYAYWIQPWTELRTVAATLFGMLCYGAGALITWRARRSPLATAAAVGLQLSLATVGLLMLAGLLLALERTLFHIPTAETYPGAQMWNEFNPRLALTSLATLCYFCLTFSVILHVALRLNEELRHQAQRDPLTGLYNRAMFEALATPTLARALRRREPCALLFIDLDHFKHINDCHGHAAGDHVLNRFAQLLQRELRRSDIIARLGGEEFCVLLPATSPEQALHIAERLVEVTRAEPLHWHADAIALTTSIGLAVRHIGELAGLLADADAALYAAKAAGRDRVVRAN